jgi:hypothetical protein
VDDAGLVGGVHGPGQRLAELGGLAGWQRGAGELPVQAAAGHELQGEVRPAVGLADLVDLHDVGVLKAGDGLGLGAEAGQFVGAGVGAGQDHLEGDQAVQAEVPGLVDDAHAAPAQFPEELVAGDDGAVGGGRLGRLRHERLARAGGARRRPAVGRGQRRAGQDGFRLGGARFRRDGRRTLVGGLVAEGGLFTGRGVGHGSPGPARKDSPRSGVLALGRRQEFFPGRDVE